MEHLDRSAQRVHVPHTEIVLQQRDFLLLPG
jgi:hypothetical protein